MKWTDKNVRFMFAFVLYRARLRAWARGLQPWQVAWAAATAVLLTIAVLALVRS